MDCRFSRGLSFHRLWISPPGTSDNRQHMCTAGLSELAIYNGCLTAYNKSAPVGYCDTIKCSKKASPNRLCIYMNYIQGLKMKKNATLSARPSETSAPKYIFLKYCSQFAQIVFLYQRRRSVFLNLDYIFTTY